MSFSKYYLQLKPNTLRLRRYARPDVGYTNAMNLLKKRNGDPHKLLASNWREIKQMSKIKPGDAIAFRRPFNFLMKCQTMNYGTSKNPLDSPDVIFMTFLKVPGHLQDRSGINLSDSGLQITNCFWYVPSKTKLFKLFHKP